MIGTELMFSALPYIYRRNTVEEFLEVHKLPEAQVEEFKEFWAETAAEVEATVLKPGVSWDVPAEWQELTN